MGRSLFRDSGGWLCRSTATTRLFRRIAPRPAQAKQGQESAGCPAWACRSSAGFARRPADSFYQQPGRAGPSLGESAAKDFWHLSECDWGHRFLPYPQLSFDDAEAKTSYALCSDCCLPWSTFTGRLGTLVVTVFLIIIVVYIISVANIGKQTLPAIKQTPSVNLQKEKACTMGGEPDHIH